MYKKRLISSIITASLSLYLLSPLHAGVYKWVDENGQVHYGEQPGNTNAEKVIIRKNETTKPRPINKTEGDIAEPDGKNTDQQAETPELVEKKIPAKEKRQLCKQAKNDIEAINSRGRMREITAKGEYFYLPDEEKQRRLAVAKKKVRKYCY